MIAGVHVEVVGRAQAVALGLAPHERGIIALPYRRVQRTQQVPGADELMHVLEPRRERDTAAEGNQHQALVRFYGQFGLLDEGGERVLQVERALIMRHDEPKLASVA